ncbi:MAG: DegT/DnrJ/EryC1/StrS family aminotransferase [Nanoarchaeota archaeon]
MEKTDWKIPLYKIFTDEEDLNLITKIIKRGNNWALGPEIEEFESEIKNYLGMDYCLTLNSGTSALHASYLAYNIKEDDEVIVPSFTFISTANSVLFVKAKPVFTDIEEETFGLDPNQVKKHINTKTKAIVPVHYGGNPCKILDLMKIAVENKLILIEDAAESLGSSVNNQKLGSVGNAAIFSFCGNKVLTTGEGGAVVTNSKEIYEKIKFIRSHGRIDKINYFNNPDEPEYNTIGYNWRMSTITASLGITQIKKLDKIIKMRQENAEYISSRLSKIQYIKTPKPLSGNTHIYQMYTIRLSDKKYRDGLHEFLTKKQIFSKVYFNPIHLTNFYRNMLKTKEGMLPITEKISKEVLTIPLYPNMTNEEKNYLVESIIEFFELVK